MGHLYVSTLQNIIVCLLVILVNEIPDTFTQEPVQGQFYLVDSASQKAVVYARGGDGVG